MLTKTFKDVSLFHQRQEKLNQTCPPHSVIILFSGQEAPLLRFRASSSFIYLTGFEEPEAAVVIRTGDKKPHTSLFVRSKDPERERWDGERFGPEGAQTQFAVDEAFSINEFEDKLPSLLEGAENVFFEWGENPKQDEWVLKGRRQAQQKAGRSGQHQAAIRDPNEVIAPLRMVKSPQEIQWIKEVCDLSAQAHVEVMKQVKPGQNEGQAFSHLLFWFHQQQAQGEAYSSIVASGPNACTLHYRANNRDMEAGDLLLVDAGAEKKYLSADITRTYPVTGKFSPTQKELYEGVLEVQKKLIDLVVPGFSLPELQEKAILFLTEKMLQLKLLSGSAEENIEKKHYRRYYPHGVGHYLGMDTHDVGLAKKGEKPLPFVPGVVITVEPGLYIPPQDHRAPAPLRGLGVRIEDDVLVTPKAPEILTAKAPKEVQEIETLMGLR